MRTNRLVGESLERLITADLFGAVLGVHSAPGEAGETIVVTVSSTSTAQTRQLIHQVLHGLPYQCVDGDRTPPRTVIDGLTGIKDGYRWRIGTQDEVGWIRDHTAGGLAITSAIPPVFDSYATVAIPDDGIERRASDSALLRVLTARSWDQPWWLGYLDTGAHDVVFDDAPKVTLYAGWHYVLVAAGPVEAGTWREDDPWRGRLPDLIYPADRSWLVSMLWDDDWRCLGGDATLIQALCAEAKLDTRSVSIHDDATPPGHLAR